jgi:hypothetical protein
MKRLHLFLGAGALALTAGRADAQVFLNEIYASHSGLDNLEFIELKGPGGTSLADHMILVVEGQCPSCGILDRAFDLSALSMPGSGYFVAGNTLVTPNDLDIGADNILENGSETFYLIDAGSPGGVAAVSSLVGTNIAWPPSGTNTSTITVLSTSTTFLDVVGLWDGDTNDVAAFDTTTVIGPDGPFLPAGIFRDEDHPNDWCDMNWLDFDPAVNLNRPTTAGAMNSACEPGSFTASFCDDGDGSLASCPCATPGASDTGCDSPIPPMQGGGLTGGIKLTMDTQMTSPLNRVTATGSGYPTGSTPTAIVIRDSSQEVAPVVFGDGIRCVGVVSLTRLAATVGGSGSSTHTFGHGAMAGVGTFYYQLWFRSTPISFCDPAAAFNLSNGATLDW